ncbi:hypothetical protein ACFFU1_03930 [Algibacter miyuki]|uniref:SGNH hydrolase-type esterase domain-containing protein n=1 Tax=Algibacter miyuki TaxID=1306933 RepID=A0ABV5GWU4_9FLAO|nr:hypothetical protein [Algibacter miyuki]MDN3664276.1 hypothetical protein [Algibacter miyuki]
MITLLIFEVCFRLSVIDFYRLEAEALNTSENLKVENAVDYLVFGDSFSATSSEINYIDMLRKRNPELSFFNVSVPGIGIREVNTFAATKIRKHKPKAIIYQIYVGNDLIDVNHLWCFENVSLFRNMYWETSDYLLGVKYLNQKSTLLKPRESLRAVTMAIDQFKPEYYNIRTRQYLNCNPSYLDHTVRLKANFKERYKAWIGHMNVFLESIPNDIPVYLVWVPHCGQVNQSYLENMKSMGAIFSDDHALSMINYPFLEGAKQDLSVFSNVKHLNPLGKLQEKNTPSYPLYFANDPHFNKNGNVVLSDFLQNHIPFSKKTF